MKISSKGRYAMRMLVDLAQHAGEGYIGLRDIAERQKVSKKYLEQIAPLLTKGGVLKTVRGFQGGYMLAKAPDRFTVGAILRLTESSLSPAEVTTEELQESSGEYAMLPIWQELDHVINSYLDSLTLQDVLDRQRERYADDYMI